MQTPGFETRVLNRLLAAWICNKKLTLTWILVAVKVMAIYGQRSATQDSSRRMGRSKSTVEASCAARSGALGRRCSLGSPRDSKQTQDRRLTAAPPPPRATVYGWLAGLALTLILIG